MSEDPAAERREQAHHLLADVPAAEHTHCAASQLMPYQLMPTALTDGPGRGRHPVQESEREADRELGDGAPVDAAGPPEQHAVALHRAQIDRVEADAVLADHPELREAGEEGVVEALHPDDELLVPSNEGHQLGPAQGSPGVVERGHGVAIQ